MSNPGRKPLTEELEESLKHCDGRDCNCWAYYQGECSCGADWTPEEVIRLRYQLANTHHTQPLTTEKVRSLFNQRIVEHGFHVSWSEFSKIVKDVEEAHGIGYTKN